MKRLFLGFITLFVLTGCGQKLLLGQLERAEMNLKSNSSLSLQILDSVNRNSLRTDKQRARYAMLYTDAQVKSRVRVADDSLVRFALDYYNRRGLTDERFNANLLMGIVQRERGNYTGAMYYLTCAEQLSQSVDDDFARGRLYGQQGVLYELYENMPKALESSRLSYEYYAKAGEELHSHFALYRSARAYITMGEYEKAESILVGCVDWALSSNPDWNCSPFLTVLLHLFELSFQGEKLLSTLSSDYMQLSDGSLHIDLARAYGATLEGDMAKMCSYVDSAWSKARNLDDSMFVNLRLYEMAKMRSDYHSSLKSYLKYSDLRYESIKSTIEKPLAESQIDYYKHSSQLSRERAKRNATIIYMVLIMVVIVAVGVMIYLREWLRRRNKEAVDMVSELDHQRQELLLRCDSMDENIRRQSSEIYNLFREKFQLIDNLSDELFAMTSKQTAESVILKHINSTLEHIKNSDAEVGELERRVNLLHNNILFRTRQQMPDLGEENYRMLCYTFGGFTSGAICYFMNLRSKQALYSRRSRLIEKIKKYDNELSEELIALIG